MAFSIILCIIIAISFVLFVITLLNSQKTNSILSACLVVNCTSFLLFTIIDDPYLHMGLLCLETMMLFVIYHLMCRNINMITAIIICFIFLYCALFGLLYNFNKSNELIKIKVNINNEIKEYIFDQDKSNRSQMSNGKKLILKDIQISGYPYIIEKYNIVK